MMRLRPWLLAATLVIGASCSSGDDATDAVATTVAPTTAAEPPDAATSTVTTTTSTTSATSTTTGAPTSVLVATSTVADVPVDTPTSAPAEVGAGGYPAQPDDVPWPTAEWAERDLPDGVDADVIEAVVDAAFAGGAEASVRSVVVVHGGAIVYERYHPLDGPDTVFASFSIAKSVVAALVGIAVDDGLLALDGPAGIEEWAGDERAAITVRHLLWMSSGLEWTESYGPGDDPIRMLSAEAAADVPIAKPLVDVPGEVFTYSTGTSAILTELLARALGGPDELAAFIDARLTEPIGIDSVELMTDGAGLFVGGIGFDATSRDFARFGLLHLRGGLWDGQRVLSEAWIDAVRAPSPANGDYGLHWWLRDDGGFAAQGLFGQMVLVLPDADLVVVTTTAPGGDPSSVLDTVVEQFAAVA